MPSRKKGLLSLKRQPHKKGSDLIGNKVYLIIDKETREKHPGACQIAESLKLENTKLNKRLFYTLVSREKFGRSRKYDKDQAIKFEREKARREGRSFNVTDVRLRGIYSHSTFKNYMRVGARFNEWVLEKGYKANSTEQAIRRYGIEYLESLENRGLSLHTVAQAKSFMGKMLDREIDYKIPPLRGEDATKGRAMSERFRGFDEVRNADLVLIAKATGGRRGDLEKLTTDDFIREKGIITGVEFKQSKGGRDRFSPILPKYQKEVTKLINERERALKDTYNKEIFERIHSKANIHSYRREYARELYKECENNKSYRDYLIEQYKQRKHIYNGNKDLYKTKDGNEYDRKSLFVTSQSLGHNRLTVVTNNYFK